MSTEQLSKTTIELPEKIIEALAAIGYQVVMPPVVEAPWGWRTIRWRAVAGLFPENPGSL